MFLPFSATWSDMVALLNPSPSLLSLPHRQFLICCRQKQSEEGDSRALLFYALCLRHKTGSFQTLEMLWADIHPFSPWQSQNILFNWILRNADEYQRPDRLLLKQGLSCSIFLTCVLFGVAAQERREDRSYLSSLQPCVCLPEMKGKGGENLSC